MTKNEFKTFFETMVGAGFSYERLADIAGTTQATVSRWICGNGAPLEHRRKKIAVMLDKRTKEEIKAASMHLEKGENDVCYFP